MRCNDSWKPLSCMWPGSIATGTTSWNGQSHITKPPKWHVTKITSPLEWHAETKRGHRPEAPTCRVAKIAPQLELQVGTVRGHIPERQKWHVAKLKAVLKWRVEVGRGLFSESPKWHVANIASLEVSVKPQKRTPRMWSRAETNIYKTTIYDYECTERLRCFAFDHGQ